MKRLPALALIVLMGLCFLATDSMAQGGAGKGMGGGAYGRMYNPSTVETVSGVVEDYGSTSLGKGKSQGVHLILKTDKESIPIHLGPSWYMDKQDVKIANGDRIEVTGSRVAFRSKPAIIASEVKKDSQVLRLRDEKGVAAWAGQGRRRQ